MYIHVIDIFLCINTQVSISHMTKQDTDQLVSKC